ncbi:MAG: Sec translocon subunit SecG [Sodalis sp. Fse]|nr:MAG: Sec translocon subunit SecG [Sodalis sp. Fse]UVK79072.1 MAG: Sec translocon subunit SecG [Sodalis sp. Ffu]
MYQALLVMLLLVAVGLVALIMMQQGNNVVMGSSSGVSAARVLFCSSSSSNFMTWMTSVLAILFFVLSLVLGNMSCNYSQKGSLWDDLNESQQVDKALLKDPAKPINDIPR